MAWWEREISVIAENDDSDSWIDRFITCCQSLICPAGCMWSSVKVCYKVTFQSRWQLMKHKALCEIYTLHIFALLLLLYDGERRTAQIWYNADREKWTGGEVCYSELRWEHTEQSKEETATLLWAWYHLVQFQHSDHQEATSEWHRHQLDTASGNSGSNQRPRPRGKLNKTLLSVQPNDILLHQDYCKVLGDFLLKLVQISFL